MEIEKQRLLIGYWPLLDYSQFAPGLEYGPLEGGLLDQLRFIEQLDGDKISDIQGILWVQHDGRVSPVFIMESAREVAEHLITWAEGDNDRFSLHVEERGDSYAMVLIPSVKKSIQRWKLARLVYHGEKVVGNDFVVYHYTLGVYCPSNVSYGLVRDKLGEKCQLGFMDVKALDRVNPQNSDFDSIVYAGPFSLGPNDEQVKVYLDNLFESVKPD